ncbi:MAG TPA: alpha-amylase family protein [Syntrophobacteraceae bacterium]|nr:alpha-amylase family protein [Syntrophobacteraceae bacterium]
MGLRAFHLDHHFLSSAVEFAKINGWPFYVDHAAGKGYLYLREDDKKKIARLRGIPVRPNSLIDPATMNAMKNLMLDHITRARQGPVVAYAFDDEISLYSLTSPSDVDGHPLNIDGFRKWLAARYPDIDSLNREWGSRFPSFQEVQPSGFDQVRKSEKEPLTTWNLSPWMDWRTYMDVHFSQVLAELTKYANSLDPATPAGFVGAQQPSPWGGYDYSRLADSVQCMEASDINGANEILRSFWGQDRPHLQTFFSSKNPRVDAWFLWYCLAHGNRGVIAWPEGWFEAGKTADHISRCASTFKEVQSDISKLIIDSEFLHDPIAIHYSHPSIQVSWAMDATVHGSSWINRSSSMDDENSVSGLNRLAWLKLLEDLGYQARFIREKDLLQKNLYEQGYRVLILNHSLALSGSEADAVAAFVKSAGMVIADEGTGLFDEHGKARARGILDELFGVSQHPEKGFLGGSELTEVNGEKYDQSDFRKRLTTGNALLYHGIPLFGRGVEANGGIPDATISGSAAVVRKSTQKGITLFLNLSPVEYLLERYRAGGATWRGLLSNELTKAGLRPRVTLKENGTPAIAVETLFWRNGNRTVLCVVKNPVGHSALNPLWKEELTRVESVKLGLQFADRVKDLVNERTKNKLGDGESFEDGFRPWEANVYSFER